MQATEQGGQMQRLSLRFLDPQLEQEYQRSAGREGRAGFVVTAGSSAVLWLVAALFLPSGTGLASEVALPLALAMSLLSLACTLAAWWAKTLDRQHGLLSLLTSVNGLVVLSLAALIGFFPGYAVSVIMLFFAYGFVARTRFIYAVLRTLVIGAGFFYIAASYPANLTIDVFIFVAMSVGTLIALRLIEKSRRSVFYQQRVIGRQAEELRLEKEKSEQVLLNMLPAHIVARLREGETTIADEYPSVTVLFADVIGFTALAARLSAAEVIALLSDIFSSFDDLVAERRLDKIKTIGDAYMAAGGLADPGGDHAVRVVELGLAMQSEVSQRAHRWHELSVRIGAHSGPAAGGVIGKQKFAFDLWGDTINTASRLEQHGLPGRVHVSVATWQLVRDHFACEVRGETQLRGLGGVQTYFVVGPAAAASVPTASGSVAPA